MIGSITPPSPDEVRAKKIIMGRDSEYRWVSVGKGKFSLTMPIATENNTLTSTVVMKLAEYAYSADISLPSWVNGLETTTLIIEETLLGGIREKITQGKNF